ncbi:hypothetical protein [Pedobacter yulinensis]|uniref:hypothetical protein n=1 Tax=Pedobacter yulinensis TaxID=2126353 RepID=UPI0013A67694|nr:hypothetical protein [Pedobacter yulinensis]
MKKQIKTLKFSKQDIADLTKEEQLGLVGGNAPTVTNCTYQCGGFTLAIDTCTVGCTGACPSNYGGTNCDPASGIENATCYMSAAHLCHTNRECTDTYCTQNCPATYGDQTCGACGGH